MKKPTGFKDVPGYNGLYAVNKEGVVYSYPRSNHSKPKFINIQTINGYRKIFLSKNTVRKIFPIHRILAITYIPNPENKPQVNHINGNKLDNRLKNLEWVTQSENVIHALSIGLGKSKLKHEDIVDIRKNYKKRYRTLSDIAKKYKIGVNYAGKVVNRKVWAWV